MMHLLESPEPQEHLAKEENHLFNPPSEKSMNKDLALRYWRISIQYFHLVQHVSNKIAEQGNAWGIISDSVVSDIEFDEMTKWSDYRLATPLLFNLYHGIELMLKGFAAPTTTSSSPKPTHRLSVLASEFNANHQNEDISNFLSKYLEIDKIPDPIRQFLVDSNITADQYYQALKYPDSTSGSTYMHANLYYHDEWGVSFYKDLRDDVAAARRAFVALGRSLVQG